jgi:hypothetical protein
MTPETLILSGRKLCAPWYIFGRLAASCTAPGFAGARARRSRSPRSCRSHEDHHEQDGQAPTRARRRDEANDCIGLAATMPAKMISELPLPMPFGDQLAEPHDDVVPGKRQDGEDRNLTRLCDHFGAPRRLST